MNFTNHKHSFSFRTIKGYGLAGAVIASVLVSQGVVAAEQVAPNNETKTEIVEYPRAVELGSVVVTHYDEDGNQLSLDVTVKDNVPAGESYTTSPKVFDDTITTNTINGLTRKTYAHYVLRKIPANDTGKVAAKETITVPYIYKRIEKNVTNGSVVAQYVDTDGNEIAPSESIKTNVEPGEAYKTEAKTFPIESLSESQLTDKYVKVTTTEYRLVETPDNQTGEVKDGEVTVVKYVYKKVVHVSYELKQTTKPQEEIPTPAPVEAQETAEVTRYMLEDRKTEIQPSVEGLVGPTKTIGRYKYTGATDSNKDGVITHIYKLEEKPVSEQASPVLEKPEFKFETAQEAPVLEKPEFKFETTKEAPVLEKPEFKFETTKEAPVLEKPEFKFQTAQEAPVLEKPAFKFETAKDAPVLEKPELNIGKDVAVKSVERQDVKPIAQPEAKPVAKPKAKKELPNTGTKAGFTGILGIMSILGSLVFFKKNKT